MSQNLYESFWIGTRLPESASDQSLVIKAWDTPGLFCLNKANKYVILGTLPDRPSAVAQRLLPTGEAKGRTMQFIYVLKSEKDKKFYVDCTSDIEKRFKMHNDGLVRSTKARRPFELVFQEGYNDKYIAFKKERFYKTAKGKKELLGKI